MAKKQSCILVSLINLLKLCQYLSTVHIARYSLNKFNDQMKEMYQSEGPEYTCSRFAVGDLCKLHQRVNYTDNNNGSIKQIPLALNVEPRP